MGRDRPEHVPDVSGRLLESNGQALEQLVDRESQDYEESPNGAVVGRLYYLRHVIVVMVMMIVIVVMVMISLLVPVDAAVALEGLGVVDGDVAAGLGGRAEAALRVDSSVGSVRSIVYFQIFFFFLVSQSAVDYLLYQVHYEES